MKKFALLCAVVCLCGGAAFSQTEKTAIGDRVAIVVQRALPSSVEISQAIGHADGAAKAHSYFGDGLAVGPNTVEITARHADGSVFYHYVGHNLKTYVGGDMIASAISNTATQPAAANYMVISSDTGTPAASDTAVTGEITTNGGARSQGTYAHTTCSAFPCTYTLTHTWTATGTLTSVQKAGVLNASSVGTLVFENTFTPVSLNSGDTLQLTWTITLS